MFRAIRPFRYDGVFYSPGDVVDIPPERAGKLRAYGVITGTREVAVVPPVERAIEDYRVGDSPWYEVRGQKVRGKEAALELLEEVDECESK